MMKLVVSVVTCIILQQVCAEQYTGSAWPVPLLGSCKEIKTKYPAAVSGDYNIQVKSGANIRVYCEMAINGGGYTFLHPASFYQIEPSDVTAMVTDTASALLSVRMATGFVKYAVLAQLDQYSSLPISITLNGDPAYRKPQNSGQSDPGVSTDRTFIGTPFLEVAFLPIASASNNAQQGVKFNGVPVTFTNCDKNPNSYFAVFPNLAEKAPTGHRNDGGPIVLALFDKTNIPGSYKHIPIDYFMLFEMTFGGCGGYFELLSTDPNYRGFQLGFR